MAIPIRDEQIQNNATVTASGNSATFGNDGGRTAWVLLVRIANAPTGTTPTITYSVNISADGVNFVQVGAALTALNAASSQRTVYAINSTQGPIAEQLIRVSWVVTGTTPSFTGVFTDLIGM